MVLIKEASKVGESEKIQATMLVEAILVVKINVILIKITKKGHQTRIGQIRIKVEEISLTRRKCNVLIVTSLGTLQMIVTTSIINK